MVVGANWRTLYQSVSGRRSGPIIVPPVHLGVFSILENKLKEVIRYVTLKRLGLTLAESPILDLIKDSECCDLWALKLNAKNTKTMIVSKARAKYLQSPLLTIGGTVQKRKEKLFTRSTFAVTMYTYL